MRKQRTTKQAGGNLGLFLSVLLFCIILAAAAVGTLRSSGAADEKSIAATRQAIEQATALCYATEGFYPPSLAYLEDRYGLHVDRDRYVVQYNVFASNVTPSIVVVAK